MRVKIAVSLVFISFTALTTSLTMGFIYAPL